MPQNSRFERWVPPALHHPTDPTFYGTAKDIHETAKNILQGRCDISEVMLRYPFPQQPLRALGLIKLDGSVYCSQSLSRIIFLKTRIAFFRHIQSVFITPCLALDLPVFAFEAIFKGRERIVLVDIKRRGRHSYWIDEDLKNRLLPIKQSYTELFERSVQISPDVKKTFTDVACFMKISEKQEGEVLALFRQYLDVYLEKVDQADCAAGSELTRVRNEHAAYRQYASRHDPAVKFFKKLFGAKGGLEHAADLFLT